MSLLESRLAALVGLLSLSVGLIENQSLQGDARDAAAKKAGLSPSMQYLVHFPQVLDQMCQQMDWTRQLGQAFQTNQKAVLDAVQGKRAQAQQMSNLLSTPQQTVTTATDNGQHSVQIQPADPKVVYVPQYNPVTIYNTPAPSASTQTTTATAQPTSSPEQKSGVSTGTAVVASLLSFGAGRAVGQRSHRSLPADLRGMFPSPSLSSCFQVSGSCSRKTL